MYSVALVICFVVGIASVILVFSPVTQIEQRLLNKLNIRKIRYLATKKNTEKSNTGKESLLERSRKNIIWHVFLTLLFTFLIFRAHSVSNEMIQHLSLFLLLPIVAYFIGTLVQRQKMVILILRGKNK